MNWIKEQIEAQRKADKENQERQQRERQAEEENKKRLSAVSCSAFTNLLEAIREDIKDLNEAKQGEEQFSIRTDDRTTLEFYKIGPLPETRLTLNLEPENGRVRYVQVMQTKGRGRENKGDILIGINSVGKPRLTIRPQNQVETGHNVRYKELSRFLLSPTF